MKSLNNCFLAFVQSGKPSGRFAAAGAILAAIASLFVLFSFLAIGTPKEPPSDAKRIGVWSWEEGYIAHLLFRDDSNLWIYIVNPEGAALWELNLDGPSKRKLIPATFLDNFVSGPDWLANVNIAASHTRRHILLWPNASTGYSPACILISVEKEAAVKAITLELPPDFSVGCADFSFDDRYLALVRHPASSGGAEILLFDLVKQPELGLLRPVEFNPIGNPALIRRVKFDFASERIWISAGIFKGEVYEPPLLVSIPTGKGDFVPLIQGNVLENGLSTYTDSVSVLLDSKAAQGKTGVDPNNWWTISTSGRNAKRPSLLKGAFSEIWSFGAGYYVGVFQAKPASGEGFHEPKVVLVFPDGIKSIFSSPRLAACSPSGEYIAVIKEGSNRLEVYKLIPKSQEEKTDDA